MNFSIHGPLRDVSYCHCVMCQRASSHYVASTACDAEALVVSDPRRKLRWYRSSPGTRRGFCARCGSQLFWEHADRPSVSVSAGSIDQPSGLRPGQHLFLDHTADYDRDADLRASTETPAETGSMTHLALRP